MRRQYNSIAGAVEQSNAEIIFERLDLQRDRGLRKKELLSSFAEVEVLGNRAEDLQPKVLQLSHGEIIYAWGILSRWGNLRLRLYGRVLDFLGKSPLPPPKLGRRGHPLKSGG